MKKQFMPLALVSLLVCSLLCTSAFAANRDTQTEPAVIEVDTAALFSTIESNEAQMVNVLEKQAGAVVVGSADMAELSSIDDVTATNALRAGGTVEQSADYVPGGNTPTKGNLAAGRTLTYRMLPMTKRQTVTISIEYTSASSEMRVGLKDSSGVVDYESVSDGSGTAAFEIAKDGVYSIYVENPSSVSIYFDVSYLLD